MAEHDVLWLEPLEEAPRLRSNQARPGDSDYHAPTAVPGKGLPKSKDPDYERKHPRGGKGSREGGRFVRKGDTGSEVTTVQHRLGIAASGTYDAGTATAVINFQRRHGLQVDGIIGTQTALALTGQFRKARGTEPGPLTEYTKKLVGGDSRGRKKTARRKGRGERVGGGMLVAGDDLQEFAGATLVPFDPASHPRDPVGRFRAKLGALRPGEGIDLGEGVQIVRVAGAWVVRRRDRSQRHAQVSGVIRELSGRLRSIAASSQGRPLHVAASDEESLIEALLDVDRIEESIQWEWREHLHPRDRFGHFVDKIGKLTPRGQAGPTSLTLPDGTRVTKDPDGTFRVVRSGRIVRGFDTARSAGFEAVQRSARTRDPSSVGGAEAKLPTQLASWVDASQLPAMSQETYALIVQNLERELANANVSSDPYVKRQVPGLRAHLTLVRAEAEQFRRQGGPQSGADAAARAAAAASRTSVPARIPEGSLLREPAGERSRAASATSFQYQLGTNNVYRRPEGGDTRDWEPISRPEGETPEEWARQRVATGALEVYRHGVGGRVVAPTPATALPDPTPPAAEPRYDEPRPGEAALIGRVFGVERLLPVRSRGLSVGSSEGGRTATGAAMYLETRDPIGIARFPTGSRTYATPIRFTNERYWTERGQPVPPSHIPRLQLSGGDDPDVSETYVMDATFYLLNRNNARVYGIHGDNRRTADTVRGGPRGHNAPDIPTDRPYGQLVRAGQAPAAASSPARTATSHGTTHGRLAAMQGTVPRHLGTRIDHVVQANNLTYLRGEDGRTWVVATGAIDGGARIDDRTVQVRTQAGGPHTAPGLEAELAGRTAVGASSSTLNEERALPPAPEGPARHGASRSGPSAAIPGPSVQTRLGTAPRVRETGMSRGADPTIPARVQNIVDALHGFSHGGYTTKVTGAHSTGFEGVVLDPSGRQVGAFSRGVTSGDSIYHSVFQIESGHRASGYGTAVIDEMFRVYKANGFKEVTVSAGLDVGGYQWAKMGFEFKATNKVQTARYLIEGNRYKLSTAVRDGRVPQALVDEFLRQSEEGMLTSPAQIAAWGRRTTWNEVRGGKTHKMWLGKFLLLGSSWSGKKKL